MYKSRKLHFYIKFKQTSERISAMKELPNKYYESFWDGLQLMEHKKYII